jgi:hypothetical protein
MAKAGKEIRKPKAVKPKVIAAAAPAALQGLAPRKK